MGDERIGREPAVAEGLLAEWPEHRHYSNMSYLYRPSPAAITHHTT
jgi:hypothetical protein